MFDEDYVRPDVSDYEGEDYDEEYERDHPYDEDDWERDHDHMLERQELEDFEGLSSPYDVDCDRWHEI